jgi:TonB family protein
MKRYVYVLSIALCALSQANAQERSGSTSIVAEEHSSAIGLTGEAPSDALSDSLKKSGEMPAEDLLKVDVMPELKSRKNPVYPEEALKKGIEGIVYVKILVDPEGKPKQTDVIKSDATVLNESAVEAAKGFVFTPALINGKPVSVWVTVPFKFKLAPERKEIQGNAQKLPSTVKKPTVLVVTGPKDLERTIKYPDDAIRKRVEGAVYATVKLNDQKRVSEVKIKSGIGAGCDEEVLRAIASHSFFEDKESKDSKGTEPLSVVVQFILPARK